MKMKHNIGGTALAAMTACMVMGIPIAMHAVPIAGVTATASSELSSYGRLAEHMVDGSPHSVWESAGVGFPGPEADDLTPWVLFDLHATYQVDTVDLYHFPEFEPAVKRMDISISTDGTFFTSLGVFDAWIWTAAPAEFNLAGAQARYIRFDILSTFGGSTYPIFDQSDPGGFYGFAGIAEVALHGRLSGTEPPDSGNSVPDGGSSVLLLGLAGVGLLLSRRFLAALSATHP